MKSSVWRPCWKLTTCDHITRGGCVWGAGATNPHGVLRGNDMLCSGAWYHAYDNPDLALLLNPIHASFTAPVLWEAEWRGKRKNDRGLKFGATELRTVRIVPLPEHHLFLPFAFAIFAAAQVTDENKYPNWHKWATNWLNGDRAWDYEQVARVEIAGRYMSAREALYAAAGDSRTGCAYAAHSAAEKGGQVVLETALAWALALFPSEG